MMQDFLKFPSISRFNREVIVTEKIDGTNAQILITEDGEFLTGSRTRWITPQDDNYGFSRWAHDHKDDLMQLGVGRHFGEWWGQGIQRKYGIREKRFSLFNVSKWAEERPGCCLIIPVLWTGTFRLLNTDVIMEKLKGSGSLASPGFMHPEGIVIWHTQGNFGMKRTFEKDDTGKGNE